MPSAKARCARTHQVPGRGVVPSVAAAMRAARRVPHACEGGNHRHDGHHDAGSGRVQHARRRRHEHVRDEQRRTNQEIDDNPSHVASMFNPPAESDGTSGWPDGLARCATNAGMCCAFFIVMINRNATLAARRAQDDEARRHAPWRRR